MATRSSDNSCTDVERAPLQSGGKDETAAAVAVDVENGAVAEAHLRNTTVRNFSWKNVSVTVKDRETKQPKIIVDEVEGIVEAGEFVGCGARARGRAEQAEQAE